MKGVYALKLDGKTTVFFLTMCPRGVSHTTAGLISRNCFYSPSCFIKEERTQRKETSWPQPGNLCTQILGPAFLTNHTPSGNMGSQASLLILSGLWDKVQKALSLERDQPKILNRDYNKPGSSFGPQGLWRPPPFGLSTL